MSQHVLNTVCRGRAVRVTLGWDRPLGYFFLLVAALDDEWVERGESSIEADAGGYLYCNLDDDQVPPVDSQLTYFERRLVELGIQVPANMFVNVEADRRTNTGNRQVMYQPDGMWRWG